MFSLAKGGDFEILEIEDDESWIELNLYATKPMEYIGFNEVRIKQKQFLAMLTKDLVVSIWGAGAKANKYCTLLSDDIKIAHLFDGDEKKIGLFASGIEVPIEMPSSEKINDSDCIIIFASSYNNAIIEKLKNDFCYEGKIIYFEGQDIKSIEGCKQKPEI
ncbi:MAG: hypothetical protein ACI4LX_05650 [Treponema sp.]